MTTLRWSGAPRVARWTAAAVPLLLFAVAAAVRLWTAAPIDFPPTEVSAYYTGVAANFVQGRGLVTDALIWYGTPPLVLPKPAFELWLPMPTFLATIPMAVFGPSFPSGQLSTVLLGGVVAPLTWAVARDAARRQRLPAARQTAVAVGAALTAAVLGPLLVADAAPESTTAFTAFGLLACWLMAGALPVDGTTPSEADRGRLPSRLALGVVLGLCYLSRAEAVLLALVYVLLLVRSYRPMRAAVVRALVPTVAGGALVVTPWLLRNFLVFGSLFPRQTVEHAWLTRNEQIFAYAERPTPGQYLAQGPAQIVGNQLEALWGNLFQVVLVSAFPVGVIGLVSLLVLRRSAAVSSASPLRALLAAGLLTYLFTSIVFPVASAWGTFRHAAGPLVVGLVVVSLLGLDELVAAAGRWRGWRRSNAWLAPAGALALAVPMALLQTTAFAQQAKTLEHRYADLRVSLASLPEWDRGGGTGTAPAKRAAALSDHPVWLSQAIGRPVIALPDEPPTTVWRLAREFGAGLVVVVDERGRYPDALRREGRRCFSERSVGAGPALSEVDVFSVAAPDCPQVGAR